MSKYQNLQRQLQASSATWLVTGVAGFIGSNLLEALLKLGQKVIGIDNFSTGYLHNLHAAKLRVTRQQWQSFTFIEGDIRCMKDCRRVVEGVDYVLHQAALGSVPRSLADPITSNEVNVSGFLNMLVAARDAGVKNMVYAASSSTYGDSPHLPKQESIIGRPLSPYAVTKYVNELYAEVFARHFGLDTVGLRYFNVFGKNQDPNGAYAAVIPRWIGAMIRDEPVFINGDGQTSRDFCYVENVVMANLLAATADAEARNEVYNVAVGDRTSLNQLFATIRDVLAMNGIHYYRRPNYRDFRPGDVPHSQADIEKARRLLGYEPEYRIKQGLMKAVPTYIVSASSDGEAEVLDQRFSAR